MSDKPLDMRQRPDDDPDYPGAMEWMVEEAMAENGDDTMRAGSHTPDLRAIERDIMAARTIQELKGSAVALIRSAWDHGYTEADNQRVFLNLVTRAHNMGSEAATARHATGNWQPVTPDELEQAIEIMKQRGQL